MVLDWGESHLSCFCFPVLQAVVQLCSQVTVVKAMHQRPLGPGPGEALTSPHPTGAIVQLCK